MAILFIVPTILLLTMVNEPVSKLKGLDTVIFYEPTCDCCNKYTKYLEGLGARVIRTNVPSIASKLTELQIPEDLWSCHIVAVEGYIAVGHVPAEAIEKLLEYKPPIKGISLPGMPPGSPGMPGHKTDPFTIYSFDEKGKVDIYMVI